jgi:SAM-dependent methyltransferase
VRDFLTPLTATYVTTDLTLGLSSYAGQLSAASDLTRLPFQSDRFSLVLASHVLEHIPDDRAAVREVHRVLRPGGIALLPVPIVHGGPTVEYDAPRPLEEMHVRAPGLDYFQRFEDQGFDVVVKRSSDYSDEHQLRSYHTHSPLVARGVGPPIGGPDAAGQEQYVPICRKGGGRQDAH